MEVVGNVVNVVSLVELANRLYDTIKQLVAVQAPSLVKVLQSLSEKASTLKNDIGSLQQDGPSVSKEGLESLESQLKTVNELLQTTQTSIKGSDRSLLRKAIDKFWSSPDISAMLNDVDGLLGRLDKDISKLVTISNYRATPKFREYLPDLRSSLVGFGRVQHILSFLEQEEEGVEVRVVAIHGEGGLGKTTLLHWTVKKLREKLNELKLVYVEFECEPDNEKAIKTKQSSIIQQILEEHAPVDLPSTAHGRDGIKKQLQLMMKRKRRICLAIDDVWKREDLRNLLPSDLGSYLPPSSYILLTTRSLDVVGELKRLCEPEAAASTSTQDEEKRCKILPYRPSDLPMEDSRELFVKHAHISPADENGVELADAVVLLCRGLPLALEVLGGHFSSEQSRMHWKDSFQRMDLTQKSLKNPRTELMGKILRGSYESLDSDERKAFLDVACFFDGWSWETVSNIVGSDELDKLNRLCFVKQADRSDKHFRWWIEPELFTGRKVVKMHPLLAELGRCKARRRRLALASGCCLQCRDTFNVLEDYEERELEGLWDSLAAWYPDESEVALGADVLKEMESLRVARIAVEGAFPPLMNLRYLDLKGANESFKLPSMRRCKQLSVLTLRNIRSSFDDAQFPDGLRELRLKNCSGLVELPSSFGRPESMLEILHVSRCSSLKRLPHTICELRRLRELVVKNSESFVELTALSMLTDLAELKVLVLRLCDCLTDLPKDIWGIKNLTEVRLEWCSSLNVIIPSISHLSSLQILSVDRVKSLELSGDCGYIWKLNALRVLCLSSCTNMTSFAEEVNVVKALGRLQSIDLGGCEELQGIPESIGALVSLKRLDLRGCVKLAKLPASIEKLSSLQTLNLSGCSQIKSLPATIINLTALVELSLSSCRGLEELPTNFGDLISLERLDLGGCHGLLKVPQSIVKLTELRSLSLSECHIGGKKLPTEIWDLISLQHLQFEGSACFLHDRGCPGLLEVPKSIGKLTALGTLSLNGCSKIERLPESIGDLLSLYSLDLTSCERLVVLPDSIGDLLSLEYLNLTSCKKPGFVAT